MKVLVTGASGFVGSHVVRGLLARGHDVVVAIRDEAQLRHHDWHADVSCISLDLATPQANVFARAGRPDALIHAAWSRLNDYRDPFHYESAPHLHYRFIRDLVTDGLTHCLVLGTCLEYGMREGAQRETQEPAPILPYSLGKNLLRQMLCGLQMRQAFSLQWVRLFYLYGAGQRSASLLAQLDAALAAGKTAFDMSPGDQVRDYLPVERVADIVCAVLDRGDFDGIVNCCSGEPMTVLDLVKKHLRERQARIELNLGVYPYPDYEPRRFWGDRTALNELLGGLA